MNYVSGFLVTQEPVQIGNTLYFGVETNAWPIGEQFVSEQASEICEKAYADLSFPLLIDFLSAKQYCIECENQGVIPRLLYCEATVNTSVIYNHDCHDALVLTFLGYDYAYPSGSYYSAVANDVLNPRGCLFSRWKKQLNQYGLMSSMEQIDGFKNDRLLSQRDLSDRISIEHGNFVTFRIFAVNNWQ